MAANHFTLHGKHTHGEVKIPLTRLEALKFFKKWSRSAQRRSRKGRRILFLMDVHRGFAVDQLVIADRSRETSPTSRNAVASPYASLDFPAASLSARLRSGAFFLRHTAVRVRARANRNGFRRTRRSHNSRTA